MEAVGKRSRGDPERRRAGWKAAATREGRGGGEACRHAAM